MQRFKLFSTKPQNARRGLASRFLSDERGTTALEFGLLAVPFFAIIGAILETALVFLASQVLDSAVQDSSRLIRTGQAQTATPAYQLADFNAQMCSRLFGIFDCTKLKTVVKVVTSFATATTPTSPIDPIDPTKWTITPVFQPGSGSQVIMVQVYYKWPIILAFGGFGLATSSDGTRMLASTRVFENEPFTS
jgi:Flp pilus assembly protein TadG